MADEPQEVESPDGEITASLPPVLAELMKETKGWQPRRGRRRRTTVTKTPETETVSTSSTDDDTPIPMTHIPGVVPEVSMREIRHMVDSGMVKVHLTGRTKKVSPAEVRAVYKNWKGDG